MSRAMRLGLGLAPQINYHFRSLVYGKLLLLWICVLAADYFLEFRFEYLWPAWLFMRSVYDSYKYQGLVSCEVLQVSR